MNENAKTALEQYRQDLKDGKVTKVTRSPIEKLAENPKSLRLAVNAMCYQCFGCSSTSASDIRGCTSKSCALFDVRPYQ